MLDELEKYFSKDFIHTIYMIYEEKQKNNKNKKIPQIGKI